jgi:hypothetical protein
LRLLGWAADMAGTDSPVEVQVFVDGQLRQECLPLVYRPDLREHFKDDRFLYAGWECSCHLPNDDPTRLVAVKAISSSGAESLLYQGTIAPLLPVGRAELCLWIKPGELYVKGWAADIAGDGSPVEVQVFMNGQLRQKCVPSTFRPELQQYYKDDRFLRAGWECSCHLPDNDPTQLIEVKSVSGSGTESLLYYGTIASLEAQGVAAFGQQREALLRLQAELHQRLEYIRHLEAEIARKNAALIDLEARRRRWPWQRRSLLH